MKIVILYRPVSEHARAVEMFVHDLKGRNPAAKLELLNVDSREGIAMISIYDITQYPAIVALEGDGTVLRLWQGDMLPLIDEVASYAYAG